MKLQSIHKLEYPIKEKPCCIKPLKKRDLMVSMLVFLACYPQASSSTLAEQKVHSPLAIWPLQDPKTHRKLAWIRGELAKADGKFSLINKRVSELAFFRHLQASLFEIKNLFPYLAKQLLSQPQEGKTNCLMSLTRLTHHKDALQAIGNTEDMIPQIFQVLSENHPENIHISLSILANLASYPEFRKMITEQHNFYQTISDLYLKKSDEINQYLFGLIGNLAYNKKAYTQIILLPKLMKSLEIGKKSSNARVQPHAKITLNNIKNFKYCYNLINYISDESLQDIDDIEDMIPHLFKNLSENHPKNIPISLSILANLVSNCVFRKIITEQHNFYQRISALYLRNSDEINQFLFKLIGYLAHYKEAYTQLILLPNLMKNLEMGQRSSNAHVRLSANATLHTFKSIEENHNFECETYSIDENIKTNDSEKMGLTDTDMNIEDAEINESFILWSRALYILAITSFSILIFNYFLRTQKKANTEAIKSSSKKNERPIPKSPKKSKQNNKNTKKLGCLAKKENVKDGSPSGASVSPEPGEPNEARPMANNAEGVNDTLYHCSLTQKIMKDRVRTPRGDYYERSAIEAHIKKFGKYPNSDKALSLEDLVSDPPLLSPHKGKLDLTRLDLKKY